MARSAPVQLLFGLILAIIGCGGRADAGRTQTGGSAQAGASESGAGESGRSAGTSSLGGGTVASTEGGANGGVAGAGDDLPLGSAGGASTSDNAPGVDYMLEHPLTCGATWLDCCFALCMYDSSCGGGQTDRTLCVNDCATRLQGLTGPVTAQCLETSAAFYDCVVGMGPDECSLSLSPGICAAQASAVDCPSRK